LYLQLGMTSDGELFQTSYSSTSNYVILKDNYIYNVGVSLSKDDKIMSKYNVYRYSYQQLLTKRYPSFSRISSRKLGNVWDLIQRHLWESFASFCTVETPMTCFESSASHEAELVM